MAEQVFINGRFLTQPGTGVQRFAVEITNALARIRGDLVVVAPSDGELRTGLDGVEVRRIGARSGHLWEQVDLPNYLRRNDSPLLLNLCNTAPLTYLNKISTVHDISVVRYPGAYSLAFRALYRVEIPMVLRSSAALLTVSEFSRDELSSYYHIDEIAMTVVLNSVGGNFREGALSDDCKDSYFLAVGSLSVHKNLDRLILAFSSLRRVYKQAKLIVVGGSAPAFSSGMMDADGMRGIAFVGRVDDARLIQLYQNATAFVFPSLYEGFGIPPLEAQACGCPVIASRAASMPEVLGDSALYCDPASVADIASGMEQMLIDHCLRDELIRRGRRNVARFSWHRSARIISNLVDSLA